MALPVTFLSLNVGMSATLAGLPSLIIAQNLDIVFLQEVRLNCEQLNLYEDTIEL